MKTEMAIDDETKRRIMDLYFNEHITIREIAKITKKSSRDITRVLRNSEYRGKDRGNEKTDGSDAGQLSQEKEDTAHELNSIPLNTMAYRLFSEGKKPIEVAITLKLSEAEATKFHLEYLRLSQLPKIPFIYEKLRGPQGISYFLSLCKLALAERMTAKKVLTLLEMANDCRLYDIENKIENYKRAIARLRLDRGTKGKELYALNDKTASAKSILNQYELAFGKLNKELDCIREQINGMKAMVEQFKVNNKVYLNIQIIAEEKVKAFLWENNAMSLLEFALAAVAEALSQDPQRQLLVEKIPPIENYNFDSFNARQTSSPYTYDYNYPHFAREKVLELSTNYYNRLVKGLTDSSISTLSAESGIPEKYNGDIAP